MCGFVWGNRLKTVDGAAKWASNAGKTAVDPRLFILTIKTRAMEGTLPGAQRSAGREAAA